MMKRLLMAVFLFAVSCFVFADTNAYYRDTNDDGKIDTLTIENEFFKISFSPSDGGKATEVIYKPQNKLMSTNYGWFQDHIVELGEMVGAKIYDCAQPYESEIIKTGPDYCKVKLFSNLPGTGKFESYKNVRIERIYTLYKDSPVINVELNVKNNSNETLPLTLMPGHWAWVDSEDSWYFVPDELGILSDFDSQVRTFSAPVGSQEPTSNFAGFLSVQSKLGLVFVMDWEYLDAIECWLSKGKAACVQWPYRKQILNPGALWSTKYVIYPVNQIESIDAANEKYTVGITAGEKSGLGNFVSKDIKPGKEIPVNVYVAGPAGGKITVEYGYRILPEEKITVIGNKELSIEKVKGTGFQFPLLIDRNDCTYVINVKIKEGKDTVLIAERPVRVGDSSYTYFMKAKTEKQTGEKYYGYQIISPPLPSWYEQVDLKVETPHVKWAKPWCNGTTKVLFVNRSDNSVGYWREIWERCDIKFDCCSLAFDEAKKFPYTQNTLKNLLRKLNENDYDVIFFSALNWNDGFPGYIQDSIFSFVKKGKGAVILGDLRNNQVYGSLGKYLKENGKEIDSSWMTKNFPYGTPKVWLYELGNGRIAIIEGNPASGYEAVAPSLGDWQAEGRWMWIPGWEYGFGLFSKSIIWAGKKESGISVKEIKADEGKIEAIIENNIGKTIEQTYLLKVFNGFYELEESKQGNLKLIPGENKIEIKIERPLTDKIHLADLILMDNQGRNTSWASCKFMIARDLNISAKMQKETSAYRTNEDIKGSITIDNKKEKSRLKLLVEVEDTYKRVVFRQEKEIEVNPGKNEIMIDIDKSKIIDIYHDMAVSIVDGSGKTISKDRHIFFVYPERMPVYDDFYLACWGNLEPNPLKIIISAEKLKEAGIDYVYSYGEGKTERYVAYKTHHLLMGPPFSCSLKGGYSGNRKADTKNLTYDPPLVPSEDELNKFIDRMSKLAKGYAEWGGADYIHLDDERDMQGDFDWSERTIAKFREWLKNQYGKIENLNQQWGTNYSDWSEVMPVRLDDVKDKNNLSQYIDWRLFTGWAICEYYYKVPAEAVKQGNPNGVVGQHGVYQPSLTIPHDFWQFSKYTPVTGRYNGMIEEWFSSFGVISGQYGGYGIEQATPGVRYFPWRSLLHGGHWAFYYILWNSGTHHQGILSPDQTVHGGYNDLAKDEFSDIKNGIGKLFIKTQFTSDGICFPYSQSSILVSQALGLSRTGNMYSQKTLIQNLGYQHRFLSYEQIANGELIKSNYKVLILPNTLCLSRNEITEIKNFVRNGGTVIADYQAGTRDQHGRVYVNSEMDELFGIDRKNVELTKKKMKLKILKDSWFGEKELEMNIPETGIRVTTGKNMAVFEDGTPAIILNNYGKGKAIYLNLDVSDYSSMKAGGVAGEVIAEEKAKADYVSTVQDIFEKILVNTNLKKRVEILDNEKPVNSGERFYYTDGTNLYFAYIPEVTSEKKVKITIDKKAHIYDVRAKKYIGNTDNFIDTLKPGNVKVYSILQYKVNGIEGNLKNQYKQGENIPVTLNVKTDAKSPGRHILRVELLKDGKNIQAYNKNLVAEKGSASFTIPLAFNEEKGNYTLVVRDINSGVETSFKFRVN